MAHRRFACAFALIAGLVLATLAPQARAAAYLPPPGKVYAGVTAGDPATYEQQTGAHAAIFQEFVTWGGAVDWALAAAEQNRSRAMLAIQTITP
jgi:hypothetical protein